MESAANRDGTMSGCSFYNHANAARGRPYFVSDHTEKLADDLLSLSSLKLTLPKVLDGLFGQPIRRTRNIVLLRHRSFHLGPESQSIQLQDRFDPAPKLPTPDDFVAEMRERLC